jgi:CBS domain-containing protein
VLAPLLIMGGSLGALEAHWIPGGDSGLWAAISMGAMMGGTMRSPFTAVAFMLELTHDINALPAVFIACIAAHGVTVLLMKRSILTEKVARRGYHLTREYAVNPLQLLRVRDVMEPSLVARGDGGSVVTYPDELLETAMRKLLEHEAEVLPVASPDDPSQVVGYVERSAILGAWVQHTRDEHAREVGWLGRLRKAPR